MESVLLPLAIIGMIVVFAIMGLLLGKILPAEIKKYREQKGKKHAAIL